MTALALQALLLMAAAYFLGAALACLIRRSFHRGANMPAERRVDPLPEYVGRDPAPAVLARTTIEPSPRAAAPAPVASPRPAPTPAAAPAAQDLKRIHLIDTETEKLLHRLGITRYKQIADWMRADVLRFAQALGVGQRIARENWIEQAQILANGGETYYSARMARGEAPTATPTAGQSSKAVASAPPPNEPLPRPMSRAGVAAVVASAPAAAVAPAPATPPSAPLVSERAAFAGANPSQATAPPAAVPVRPAPRPERDNLQRIGGITGAIEQALNANGVTRYAQIAQWGAADVERFESVLVAGGRIARENWIEQAHILSRGGDTRFSREFDGRPAFHATKLADAIRDNRQAEGASSPTARTDLGALRSVRSQAYQNMPEPGPEAARRAAERAVVSSGPDDLKRIRGIGVLIEKRLGSLGVSTYEHIANWTAADIERISQSLDFKGRIERENWVEQARILSAGGHTEFSRRVDRGEVETSRPRD